MKDSKKNKRKHQNHENFTGVSRRNFVKGAATIAAVAESALTTRCREEPKMANAIIGSSIV